MTSINGEAAGQTAAERAKPHVSRKRTRKGTRVARGTAPKLLLVAAQELFAERGPLGTTTRQIAERADVSEDLIFRYYGSKTGLLEAAVLKPLMESLEAMRLRWIEESQTRSDWDDERSRVFVGQLYDLVAGNRTVAMTMMHLLVGGPAELDDVAVRQSISEMFSPLGPAFDNHVGGGTRRTDPALLLRLLMILICSTAAYLDGTYASAAEVPPKARVVEELVQFMQYGIRSAPAPKS
jgi:AcrR family transcriptional regulator